MSFISKLKIPTVFSLIILSLTACTTNKTFIENRTSAPTSTHTPTSTQLSKFYLDADGDGFGDPNRSVERTSAPVGYVADNTDCNDKNKKINPAIEMAENLDYLTDVNCDGIYSYFPQVIINSLFPAARTKSWDPQNRKVADFVHTTLDPTSPILQSSELTYDLFGKILIYKEHASGDLTTGVSHSREFSYNDNGDITLIRLYGGDLGAAVTATAEYLYNAQGDLIASKTHDPGYLDSPVNFSTEYTYDSQGNLTTKIFHSGDLNDPISQSEEYTYDGQGNRIITRYRDLNTVVYKSEVFTYDEEGNKIIKRVHNQGDLDTAVSSTQEYIYDPQSNLIASKSHSQGYLDTPVTSSTEYIYDSQGNLITENFHLGDLDGPIDSFKQYSDYIPIEQPLTLFN